MIEFIRSAPVDTALLLITVFYAAFAYRVLRDATRRDSYLAEPIRKWAEQLEEAARQRDKQRPSPAE